MSSVKKRSFSKNRSKAWINKRLIFDAVQPTSSFPASDEDIVSIPDLAASEMSSQTLVESKSTQTDLSDIFSICDNYYESQDSSVESTTASEDGVITEDEPFENAEISRKYFLVDIGKLKALFECGFICGNSYQSIKATTNGSMIRFDIKCVIHLTSWCSQFSKQRICEGNILMSAGILLSGLSYEPIHKVMEISRMQFLGKSSFYSLQRNYLYPAINHVYN